MSISANASGVQKEDHPKSFLEINIEFVLEADDLNDETVKKAIAGAETICAAGAMIKGNAETSFSHIIKKSS